MSPGGGRTGAEHATRRTAPALAAAVPTAAGP